MELNMRNLCDLAFIFQDYELAAHSTKLPLSDFKSIKAQRHAASCQELYYFSSIMADPAYSNSTEFKNNVESAY